MEKQHHSVISIVIPVFNESAGLKQFHGSLIHIVSQLNLAYEIIYCDDGSHDITTEIIHEFINTNSHVRLIKLSRNFGKEAALTAGIASARGDAVITLDGDGQHPVKLIPEFISAWEKGAQIVVGIRTNPSGKGIIKNTGPKVFNKLYNLMTGQEAEVGSSDYRLISRTVQVAFLSLTEDDRVTRNLIDWLGYKRAFIHYESAKRHAGTATYSTRQLINLATNSFVSSSPRPLYLFGYIGIIITISTFILGTAIVIEQLILNDPFGWEFTGTAMLGVLILFMVGIILMSQGILSIYVSRIHTLSKRRPLYVIDEDNSINK